MPQVRRLLACVAAGVALAGCGTTVPLAQQVGASVESGQVPGQVVPSGGATAGTGIGELPGGAPSAVPAGGAVTGPTAGSGGVPGQPTQGATATQVPTSGFGWDAHTVYIGVPTADDFNTVAKNGGAAFDNGDVHGDMEALATDINRTGGILGRKVKIVYHDASTVQISSNPSVVAQSMCTYFTQDRPVAAVINGMPQLDAQANFHGCLEKRKVTLISLTNTVYSDRDYLTLGPHLYTGASLSTNSLVPTLISSLTQQGWFSGWNTTTGTPSPSPAKVGLLLPDDPAGRAVGALMRAALNKAGRTVAKEFYYPAAGTGNQSQAEVLAFKAARVTHVLKLPPVELEIAFFQRQAEQQKYRPRYGLTSMDLPLTVEENAAIAPPVQQIGSMGIGWQPLNDTNAAKDVGQMPGGKRCFTALKAGKQTFSSSQRRAAFIGVLTCDALYLLRDAMVAGPGFSGGDLLRAMPVVGPRFTPASTFRSVLSGNDHGIPGFYRDLQYGTACSCFGYVGANRPFTR